MVVKPETNENKSEKKTKSRSNRVQSIGKRFRLIIPVIIIICVIGLVWLILNPDVVVADKPKAQLVIDFGTIQVKHAGESWITAENGTYLYQSDSIKTGDNTSASIILFETSIIRLDSNTEVTIQELIQQEEETSVIIEQDAGRTWNTVSKMSGIDNYEVQTPTTVASVRGTSFDFYILANGNISISIGNGTVNVTTYKNGEILYSIEVPEYLTMTVDPENLNETPESKPLEEDNWIIENQKKDDEFRGDLKEEIYKRIGPFLLEIRKQFGGPTDEELEALIEGYILGYFDLPDDLPEWAKKLFEFK